MSVLWVDIHVMLVRTVTTPLDPIAVWSIVEQASEELLMGSVVKVQHVSVCMCYAHICVCVLMYVWVYSCLCTCVWSPVVSVGCLPQLLNTLFTEAMSSTKLELTNLADISS